MKVCNSSDILSVIRLIKIVVTFLQIGVPIMLLLFCSFTAVKSIVSDDSESLSKLLQSFSKRIIAAVAIFLIPTIIQLLLSITGDSNSLSYCMKSANIENIELIKKEELAKKQAMEERLAKQREENRKKIQEIQQKYMEEHFNNSDSNNKNLGVVTSDNIVSVSTNDLGCTLYYSDHVTVLSSLRFNSEISTNVHNILSNLCEYSNRTPWINKLETAGAYVDKGGTHGRGLAIDLFNRWTFTNNGKTYNPYSGQGVDTFSNYNKFICEQCNGREDCAYNINYQIYKSYFKGNGWCWGGDFSEGYFDPMHYEYTGESCGNMSSTNRISCGG